LNLADINGLLLSTGLWMVIMRTKFRTMRTSGRWSEPNELSAPARRPSTKPSTSCHMKHPKTGWNRKKRN